MTVDETLGSEVIWEDGAPRSRLHGDVYFSRDDGLAESRAVFLTGCGLPDAWAGRNRFVVGELGFGTGLNIAALLDLWSKTRDPHARLHIFSIEAKPLTAAEARRALASWPELAPIVTLMTDRWPTRARGFHRMDLPELGAIVDVAILDVQEALSQWRGAADAWFLDGFAPTVNPDMWRDEVLALVAAHTAPGGRAATYTVAGAVRRGLAAAGFSVERRPGHGRKRERLEARVPGAVTEHVIPTVAVIGAGIAGASLARAFGALGVEPTVFDTSGPGTGASGAPAGLMAPRLDAGLGAQAALFAQASRRAARLYDSTPDAVIATGARQIAIGPKDAARFSAIANSDLFASGAMRFTPPGDGRAADLFMTDARVVEPATILSDWLKSSVRSRRIAGLGRADGTWRLIDSEGATVAEADWVCVAAGMGCLTLAPGLILTPVRGQATLTVEATWGEASVFGAYVIPTRDGLLFGATHDRGEIDSAPRPGDRDRNLAALASALPDLAARLATAPLTDWTAVRATTSDYFPLAGAVLDGDDGRLVLTGLGSRGFCLAPLLAEHVAAIVLGAPSPLPAPLADLVAPGRFAARAARKGRPRER